MKPLFGILLLPALAFLGLVACELSPLLTKLQDEVAYYAQTVETPTIVPAGEAYRSTVPAVTLTAPTSGSRLFYTLDGTAPVYNTIGRPDWPQTSSSESGTMGWSTLGTGEGAYPVRAVAWRDGVVSAEASAVFRVAGDLGPLWVRSSPNGGRINAVARGADEVFYAGGWVPDSGGSPKAFLMAHGTKGQRLLTNLVLPSPSEVNGLAADASGGLYAVGNLTAAGTYDFGNGQTVTVTAAQAAAGFLAKFVPVTSGTVGWFCQWVVRTDQAAGFSGIALYTSGTSSWALVAGTVPGGTARAVNFSDVTASGGTGTTLSTVKTGTTGFVATYLVQDQGVPANEGKGLGFFFGSSADGDDWFNAVAAGPTGLFAVAGGFAPSASATATYGSVSVTGTLGAKNPLIVAGTVGSATAAWARTSASPDGLGAEFLAVAVNPSTAEVAAGGYQTGGSHWTWDTWIWTGSSSGKNAFTIVYSSSGVNQGMMGALGATGTSTDDSMVTALTYGPYNSSLGGHYLYGAGTLGPGYHTWGSASASTQAGTAPFLIKMSDPIYLSRFRTAWSSSASAGYTALAPGLSATEDLSVGGWLQGTGSVDFGSGATVAGAVSGSNPVFFRAFD